MSQETFAPLMALLAIVALVLLFAVPSCKPEPCRDGKLGFSGYASCPEDSHVEDVGGQPVCVCERDGGAK